MYVCTHAQGFGFGELRTCPCSLLTYFRLIDVTKPNPKPKPNSPKGTLYTHFRNPYQHIARHSLQSYYLVGSNQPPNDVAQLQSRAESSLRGLVFAAFHDFLLAACLPPPLNENLLLHRLSPEAQDPPQPSAIEGGPPTARHLPRVSVEKWWAQACQVLYKTEAKHQRASDSACLEQSGFVLPVW